MLNKIALGTVQFGLNYGINNDAGQINFEEAKKILALCVESGIDTIDTAYAYGNSETVLGKIGIKQFKTISKLPTDYDNVLSTFKQSLERLNTDSVYGYMLHNFSIYRNNKAIINELYELRNQGLVSKIGVSLYSPAELEELFEDEVELDIVQVPYNLFDRRFEDSFDKLKKQGVEIHTRSAFLQGLFFKASGSLPTYFNELKSKFEEIENFKKKYNLSTIETCLGYILKNHSIDKVVIGVDSVRQLNDNINAISSISNNINWEELRDLRVDDINIINPSMWKI
jgi:aryl-alcohol dehydrogenase-like predicted oxidoreductase